jgi:hypothetical protein
MKDFHLPNEDKCPPQRTKTLQNMAIENKNSSKYGNRAQKLFKIWQ